LGGGPLATTTHDAQRDGEQVGAEPAARPPGRAPTAIGHRTARGGLGPDGVWIHPVEQPVAVGVLAGGIAADLDLLAVGQTVVVGVGVAVRGPQPGLLLPGQPVAVLVVQRSAGAVAVGVDPVSTLVGRRGMHRRVAVVAVLWLRARQLADRVAELVIGLHRAAVAVPVAVLVGVATRGQRLRLGGKPQRGELVPASAVGVVGLFFVQ